MAFVSYNKGHISSKCPFPSGKTPRKLHGLLVSITLGVFIRRRCRKKLLTIVTDRKMWRKPGFLSPTMQANQRQGIGPERKFIQSETCQINIYRNGRWTMKPDNTAVFALLRVLDKHLIAITGIRFPNLNEISDTPTYVTSG